MPHPFCGAMALAAALIPATVAQDAADDPADLVAAAHLARARGAQAEFLACGYKLRDLCPNEPVGPFIIAAAHGSLGPSFAKDVALHACSRFLALTRGAQSPAAEQRLIDIGGQMMPARKHRRGTVAALRDLVRAWQADLAEGAPLLIAPDKPSLARAHARAERRVEQVAGWATAERKRLDRARKQKQDAERRLQRERTRKRALGEGFRDLQPFFDRIASAARTIAASERMLSEHDATLRALRAEAKRLADRLSAME